MAKINRARDDERSAASGRGGKSQTKEVAFSSTPLNFKVAEEFHREFKTYAAQHGKTMVEVLHEAFSLLRRHDSQ